MPQDERQKNQHMMSHQDDWPRWPILPVKRRSPNGTAWPDVGFMFSGEGFKVFRGSVFSLKTNVLRDFPVDTYPDIDALLDAGWVVD